VGAAIALATSTSDAVTIIAGTLFPIGKTLRCLLAVYTDEIDEEIG
jgi:hypothetical protein